MFKQIYRFLSIILISNVLFSPAALSQALLKYGVFQPDHVYKYPYNDDNDITSTASPHKKSLIERIFHHKKPVKPDPRPDIKQNGNYLIKYGVFKPHDIDNTYPEVK